MRGNIGRKVEAAWKRTTDRLIIPGILLWVGLYVVLSELTVAHERRVKLDPNEVE